MSRSGKTTRVDAPPRSEFVDSQVPEEAAAAAYLAFCRRMELDPEDIESVYAITSSQTPLVAAGGADKAAKLLSGPDHADLLDQEAEQQLAEGLLDDQTMAMDHLRDMCAEPTEDASRFEVIQELRRWHDGGKKDRFRRKLLRARDEGMPQATDALMDRSRELLRQKRGEGIPSGGTPTER